MFTMIIIIRIMIAIVSLPELGSTSLLPLVAVFANIVTYSCSELISVERDEICKTYFKVET